MASLVLKLAFLFFIQLLQINRSCGLASYNRKVASQKAAYQQCAKIFSRFSHSSDAFQFSNKDSLSLLTVSVVTQQNVGEYFGYNKLSLTEMKHNISQKGTLLLQHLTAYPAIIKVNWSLGNVSNNNYSRNDEELYQKSYSWNYTHTTEGTMFKMVHVLQLSASLVFLDISYTGYANPSQDVPFISKFAFVYIDDIRGNNFQFPRKSGPEKQFWMATVESSEGTTTLKVCLPMYQVKGNDNWIYSRFPSSAAVEDDTAEKNGVVVVLLALVIVGGILIFRKCIIVIVNAIKNRNQLHISPTRAVSVVEEIYSMDTSL